MEAKCYDELQSFLSKFTFLCVHGVNATLNINSFLGNVYVNLNADLGPTHPQVIPHDRQEEIRPFPHVKPSRLWRRKRRQRERAIAKEFIDAHVSSVMKGDTCNTVTCDEVESSMEDGQTLLDDGRSLSDQTPIYFWCGHSVWQCHKTYNVQLMYCYYWLKILGPSIIDV